MISIHDFCDTNHIEDSIFHITLSGIDRFCWPIERPKYVSGVSLTVDYGVNWDKYAFDGTKKVSIAEYDVERFRELFSKGASFPFCGQIIEDNGNSKVLLVTHVSLSEEEHDDSNSNTEDYESLPETNPIDYKSNNMLNIQDIIGHEIALVGFRYHCDDDWQEEYTEGYQFTLERDYGNDYDDHAVAVYDEEYNHVAYVSRNQAPLIWHYASKPILCTADMVEDSCIMASVDGYEDGSDYGEDDDVFTSHYEEEAPRRNSHDQGLRYGCNANDMKLLLDYMENEKKAMERMVKLAKTTGSTSMSILYPMIKGTQLPPLKCFKVGCDRSELPLPAQQLEDIARMCHELIDFVLSLKKDGSESREILELSIKTNDGTDFDSRVYFMFMRDLSILYEKFRHEIKYNTLEFIPAYYFHRLLSGLELYIGPDWDTVTKHAETLVNSMIHGMDDQIPSKVPEGFNFWMECFLSQCDDQQFVERYRVLMYRFASMLAKLDDKVTGAESAFLACILMPAKEAEAKIKERQQAERKEKRAKKPEKAAEQQPAPKDEETKKDQAAIAELDALIGLESVKEEIRKLQSFIQIQSMRKEQGLPQMNIAHHFVFTGNPGTGKTTVARILAKIYKELGVVRQGQLIETDRSGLVAEYVGQTAVKTNKVIDSALDGVLFIDEAYSLVQGGKEDFGAEAIATLLKRMEDNRDRLVVILAGYTEDMKQFIASNPGLQSRFNRYIEFPDYSATDLLKIFNLQLAHHDYRLTATASTRTMEIIEAALAAKSSSFGNARYVRNLFERTIENQAVRLAEKPSVTREELMTIEDIDIQ